MLEFRLAGKGDLENLDVIRDENLRSMHVKRLENQEKGLGEYLIAFSNKKPVAHLYLRYESKRSWINEPVLEDLYVKENERKKGYAKELVEYALIRLKENNYKKAGIAVETHEDWIKNFYEKLGFKQKGRPHTTYYTIKEKGNKRFTEIVYYLVKTL